MGTPLQGKRAQSRETLRSSSDQFPYPFVRHFVCSLGRSLDARPVGDGNYKTASLCAVGPSQQANCYIGRSNNRHISVLMGFPHFQIIKLSHLQIIQLIHCYIEQLLHRSSIFKSVNCQISKLNNCYIEQLLHFRINGISTSSNHQIVSSSNYPIDTLLH